MSFFSWHGPKSGGKEKNAAKSLVHKSCFSVRCSMRDPSMSSHVLPLMDSPHNLFMWGGTEICSSPVWLFFTRLDLVWFYLWHALENDWESLRPCGYVIILTPYMTVVVIKLRQVIRHHASLGSLPPTVPFLLPWRNPRTKQSLSLFNTVTFHSLFFAVSLWGHLRLCWINLPHSWSAWLASYSELSHIGVSLSGTVDEAWGFFHVAHV